MREIELSPDRQGSRAFPAADMSQLLSRDYVAPHPVVARKKISETYSCELSLRGSECRGITVLRQLVASIDTDLRYAKCLLISAPHTHWGNETVIESFDSKRNLYLIGPHTVQGELVVPYSFVFSSEGPIPFEWADHSVPLNLSEFAEVWEFIWHLNELVISEFYRFLPIPLGITIDHRFKKYVLDEQLFSFIEGPSKEENGRAVVRAVVESVVHPNPVYPDQVQVAWSSFPDSELLDPQMNSHEAGVLLKLEKILQAQDPSGALQFAEELELHLRSESDPIKRLPPRS